MIELVKIILTKNDVFARRDIVINPFMLNMYEINNNK